MYELLAKIANPIGIIGVIFLLIAYFALSVERLSSKDLTYQILNFLGGSLILFSLFFEWNTPAVIIEVAWVMISIFGIYRILFKRS